MTYTQKILNGRTGEEQIIPLTAEEIAEIEARKALIPALQMEEIRSKRNRLLAETDWVVTKELEKSTDGLGLQIPTQWIEYRQALRDLPANTPDPANPVWPVKPE